MFPFQDYVKLIQQRILLEVAILYLIFGGQSYNQSVEGKIRENTLTMSNWKIGDLSKSLLSFLMGSGGSQTTTSAQRFVLTFFCPIKKVLLNKFAAFFEQ